MVSMRAGEALAWIASLIALGVAFVGEGFTWFLPHSVSVLPILAQQAPTPAEALQYGIWGATATSVGATLTTLVRMLLDHKQHLANVEELKTSLAQAQAAIEKIEAELVKVRGLSDETAHKNRLLIEENVILVQTVAEHLKHLGQEPPREPSA